VEDSIKSTFMSAAHLVLEEIGFVGVQVSETKNTAKTSGLLAMIGIVGALKGHLVLEFESEVATTFISMLSDHLDMGKEDLHDAKYQKAAIAEISNQIGGRTVALLSEGHYDCMITPPTVLTGRGVDAVLPESNDRFAFFIEGKFGRFECIIALKGGKSI